jgi:hypothetical protein
MHKYMHTYMHKYIPTRIPYSHGKWLDPRLGSKKEQIHTYYIHISFNERVNTYIMNEQIHTDIHKYMSKYGIRTTRV